MSMQVKRPGVLFVISAPSGTGKSTLVRRLVEEFPSFNYSVSYTTRGPREGERDGQDYHFVDKEKFLELKGQDFFAEWAEVHGNYYGTPLSATRKLLAAGKDILFDIDVQGAKQLQASFSQGCFIFLLPPSRQELRQRLHKRASENEDILARRLENAKQELFAADFFNHWVINSDLDTAYDQLRAIYLAEQSKPKYLQKQYSYILSTWEE